MKIDFFVINLDRSPERLAAIGQEAAALGIDLIRVPAVDGKTIPEAEQDALDRPGFLRDHGKRPMPGEYGCYLSHIAALRRIADGEAEAGVVFEDDIRPLPDLQPVLASLAEIDDWDLVRFAHHRRVKRKRLRDLARGRELCATYLGPTGSAAAYIVRREAAGRLADALLPMRLPYDVALERGWATGVRALDIWPDLVGFGALSKTSLTQESRRYGSMKLPVWRRWPTLLFRAGDLARRIGRTARLQRTGP